MELANITSFHKGKGDKNDMDNDRGVFGVTIFRHIFDRLIYNDEYSNIDKNLGDSNVGARKGRNHRYNLFVLYAVINSAIKGELEAIDLQLFDVIKMFDKLWIQEVINDLYDANLKNDHLYLLYKENQKNSIAVKTPYRISKRFEVDDIVMQGTVFAPLQATTSMSQLDSLAYKRGKPLLNYKDTVSIPALGMIDDIATVTKCGIDTVISNSVTNTFVESKRLQLGPKKSHRLYFGCRTKACAELKIQ